MQANDSIEQQAAKAQRAFDDTLARATRESQRIADQVIAAAREARRLFALFNHGTPR